MDRFIETTSHGSRFFLNPFLICYLEKIKRKEKEMPFLFV